MSDSGAQRRLPALWPDRAKVYVVGTIAVTVVAVAIGFLLLATLPRDWFGLALFNDLGVGLALLACLVLAPLMALVGYSVVENVRPALRRAAFAGVILLFGTIALFIPILAINAGLVCFLPLIGALLVWTSAFFLLCREKPVQVAAARPATIFSKVTIGESRGGFASYAPDAAIEQAVAQGQSVWVDRLLGLPGSPAELLRLAIALGLAVALVGASVYGAAAFLRLPLGLPIAIAVSLFAALFGGWLANRLMQSYRAPVARGLAWGFCAAAGFLISLRIVLGLVLAAKFRLDGSGAEEAGIRAFHGAAWFTLMVAMPCWAICVLWGLARRRQADARPPAPAWRRIVPIVFVVAVMIFLAREGAYMDSLTQR